MPVNARRISDVRTGRERRLEFTARFQAQCRWLGFQGMDAMVVLALEAFNGRFRLLGGIEPSTRLPPEPGVYHGFGSIPQPPFQVVFRFQLQQPDGSWFERDWGGGDVPSAGRKLLGEGLGVPFTGTVTGSFTAWIDATEWKRFDEDARVPRTSFPVPHPEGGIPNVDWLGLCDLHYGEAPRAGGRWGWRLLIEGGTDTSNEGTIPAQPAGSDDSFHESGLFVGATQATNRPNAATIEGGIVSAALQQSPPGCAAFSQSTSLFSASCEPATSRHWFLSKHGTHSGFPGELWYCLFTTSAIPAIPVKVAGKVVGMYEGHYDGTNRVRIRRSWQSQLGRPDFETPLSGRHEEQFEIRGFATGFERNQQSLFSQAVERLRGLRLWLPATWLAERGEQANDWRILIFDDRAFAPVRIRHRRKVVLDALSNQAGWEAFNATIVPGAFLEVVTTGPGAWVGKNYEPPLRCGEHRFFGFEAMAAGGPMAAKLRLHGEGRIYEYPVQIPQEWGELSVDLCAPPNSTAATDTTDHAFTTPGEFHGPRRIARVELAELPSGRTFRVRNLQTLRRSVATYCGTAPNQQQGMEFEGDDGLKRWRGAIGLADRRQAMDWWLRQEHQTNPSQTGFLTLAEWRAALQATGAFDMRTELPPPGASELRLFYGDLENRLLAHIADARLVGSGVPEDMNDRLVGGLLSGNAEVPLQEVPFIMRFDRVTPYPGIGDPAGAFDGPFPLRYVKRLRMYVQGLVVDPPQARGAPAVAVKLKRGATELDSDFTDELGYFRLGPFTPSAGAYQVWTEQRGDVTIPALHTNRHHRRMALRQEEAPPPPALLAFSCDCEPFTRREVVWGLDAGKRPTAFIVDRPTRATISVEAKALESVEAAFASGLYLPDGRSLAAFTTAAGSNRLAKSERPWLAWTVQSLPPPDVAGFSGAAAPVLVAGTTAGHSVDPQGFRESGRLYGLLFGLFADLRSGLPLSIAVGKEGDASEWSGWKSNDVARSGASLPLQSIEIVREASGFLRAFYSDAEGIRSYVPAAHRSAWNAGARDLGGWNEGRGREQNLVIAGPFRHPAVAIEKGGRHHFLVAWREGTLQAFRLRWLGRRPEEHAWEVRGPVPAATIVDVGDVPSVLPEQKVAVMFNPMGELRMYFWDGRLRACTLRTAWGAT